MHELLKQLVEKRVNAWEHAKSFLARADEKGVLSAEDEAAFQAANQEVSDLDARIRELHEINEANKKAEAYAEDYNRLVAPEVREQARRRELSAFRSLFNGETSHLDLDLSALRRVVDPSTGRMTIEPRAALGEDSAAAGGNTVPTDFLNQLYQHMIHAAAIRQTNVRILETAAGNPIELPKTVSHSTAVLTGEGTAIAGTDPSFGKLTLNAWKYGKLLTVSNELLADTGVDIEGYIAQDLGRALGQATGAAFITGTGSNQPRGVVTAVAADAGTAVQIASATIETDNLIDLYYAPTPPYRANAFWLMADGTEKDIRKKKNASGDYVWQPSLQAGTPDQLLGRPVIVDPNMPARASAAKSVLFGDFSGFVLREAGPIRVETSTDFAFDDDATAYRGVQRVDSDLLDPNAIDALDTD